MHANVKCVEPFIAQGKKSYTLLLPPLYTQCALGEKKINRNRIKCFASFIDEKTDAIRSEMRNNWPTSGHNVNASRSLKEKTEKILFTSTKFATKVSEC